MDKIIKLEPELVYHLYVGEDDDCYKVIDCIFAGEWRWGVNYELVIQDNVTGKYFSAICQEQIGDHYYNSFDPEFASSPITFHEVVPKAITTYRYERISDGN